MKALVVCDLGHKVREAIRHQVGTLIIRPDEFSSIVDEELRETAVLVPPSPLCGRRADHQARPAMRSGRPSPQSSWRRAVQPAESRSMTGITGRHQRRVPRRALVRMGCLVRGSRGDDNRHVGGRTPSPRAGIMTWWWLLAHSVRLRRVVHNSQW